MKLIKITSTLLLLITLVIYSSCKKETPISNIPAIKFVFITPATAQKYVDTIKIVVSYTDGDGDLGSDSATDKNLYVTDSRNNVTTQFRIPKLSSSTTAIQGNLDIVLSPQGFINDSHTTETATYSIYLTDRAGNKSNTVQTSALTINQ